MGNINNMVLLNGKVSILPELKTTKNGNSVTDFHIAVYMGKETTNFFRIVTWGELAKYVYQNIQNKGTQVQVIGTLHSEKGKNGNYYTYITASSVARDEYGRRDQNLPKEPVADYSMFGEPTSIPEENIPF